MRFSKTTLGSIASLVSASSLFLCLSLAGCDAGFVGEGGAGGGSTTSLKAGSQASTGAFNGNGTGASTGSGPDDNCSESAKLIYLVSVDDELISFNPTVPGTAAYKLIGTLDCPAISSPQSMSVNRNGTAFVFYDEGALFQVSTTDASCQSTSYVHPVQSGFNQLGMGFTATTPDTEDETLFVVSPVFGLATVAFPSLAVSQLGVLQGSAAELTGGIDGKLFHFDAGNAQLNEVDRVAYTRQPVHAFSGLAGTQAWAFSRYAGKFYMFTSPGQPTPTRTTEYDPVTNVETVRDANIGYVIVGAGQSTCVPPPPPPQ